jgi:hypothetical protein
VTAWHYAYRASATRPPENLLWPALSSRGHRRHEGVRINPEDEARLSPLVFDHINLLGRYAFSVCAVKRARNSSGRRITHPATVAPAGSNRSVRSGQLLRAKPSVQKVAEKAISERAGHNMSERRVSLEKRNVNAELVRNKRRPPSLWEASDKSTAEEHRGNGDGMCAKEGCVNTGSPMPRARAQPEAREGEAGRYRVAERSVMCAGQCLVREG